jgi:hypothetical protein
MCKAGTAHTSTGSASDTCPGVSTKYKLGWDVQLALNPGLDCIGADGKQKVIPAGEKLCVGVGEQHPHRAIRLQVHPVPVGLVP